MLFCEIAKALGEHVGQIDLLVEPADHDLQGYRLHAAHRRTAGAAAPHEHNARHDRRQPMPTNSHTSSS